MAKPKHPLPVVERMAGRWKKNHRRGVVRFGLPDAEEIAARRLSGEPIPAIVAATGWPLPTVRHVLETRGLIDRQPHRPPAAKEPPRPVPPEKPNPIDIAKEWLVLRQYANARPARFKEADNQFWLLDERGTWHRAGLDQVMREAYRVARRNGVRLELPNPNWMT